MLVNAATRDFRIREDSPCRDGGEVIALPDDRADLDLDGNLSTRIPGDMSLRARIQENAVDMGAFEWAPAQP